MLSRSAPCTANVRGCLTRAASTAPASRRATRWQHALATEHGALDCHDMPWHPRGIFRCACLARLRLWGARDDRIAKAEVGICAAVCYHRNGDHPLQAARFNAPVAARIDQDWPGRTHRESAAV